MTRHDVWAGYLDEPAGQDVAEDEREALDRIRAVLADPDTWSEPPEGLTARVLELAAADDTVADADPAEYEGRVDAADPATDTAVTAAEADATVTVPSAESAVAAVETGDAATSTDGTGSGAGGGSSARRRAERRWSGRRTGWIAGAVATAAAAVVAVVLLWPSSNLRSYPISGTAAQPGASAVVTLDPKPAGVDISIEITGLPPSTEDTYYAAWLRGPQGTVPVGSFHWKKAANPISLWSGVEADRYPTFFITRQREGDPPTPSADVVLQGQVT
jgi:hypothetical protein